tara:strand:- start:891 stop:1133 length:243 start_codon:yes stop_codon:yes gene_type:complete
MRSCFLSIVFIPLFASDVFANPYVNDNLNAADQMFKYGMDGCMSVSVAIMAANSPSIYGPTSSSLRSELKNYAEKCDLRY